MTKMNGTQVAKDIISDLKNDIDIFQLKPKAVIFYSASDEASIKYVEMKSKKAAEIGVEIVNIDVNDLGPVKVSEMINDFNNDDEVSGIMIQEPIFDGMVTGLEESINPDKDIDGLTSASQGKLLKGGFGTIDNIPATPMGVWELLSRYDINFSGSKVLIIGRSNLFGKPMASIMINEGATVTVANSHTTVETLYDLVYNSDIVISAAGYKHLLNSSMFKSRDNIVVDVGMNFENGKTIGDIDLDDDFKNEPSNMWTPTPGGTGPMTIACLLKNIVRSSLRMQSENKLLQGENEK